MTNDEYKAKYLNILTEGYFETRSLFVIEENKVILDRNKKIGERIFYIIIGIVGFSVCGIYPFSYMQESMIIDDYIGLVFLSLLAY